MSHSEASADRALPAAYRERLLPGAGTWVLAGALVAMLAIAYGAGVSPWAGWLVGGVGAGLAVGLIIVTAPAIRVDSAGVRVGRAVLPAWALGACEALERDDLARARDSDARAYLMLRPLVSRSGVRIEVADPEDPHPYWLVSSRHSDRLASSLRALADNEGRPT